MPILPTSKTHHLHAFAIPLRSSVGIVPDAAYDLVFR